MTDDFEILLYWKIVPQYRQSIAFRNSLRGWEMEPTDWVVSYLLRREIRACFRDDFSERLPETGITSRSPLRRRRWRFTSGFRLASWVRLTLYRLMSFHTLSPRCTTWTICRLAFTEGDRSSARATRSLVPLGILSR